MDDNEKIVRLRGLPWSANATDVIKFLDGCEIVSNEKGIHFVMGLNGRASGEAFVELATLEDVKKALTKDKHHIGRRYIDVFKARSHEMAVSLNPSALGDHIVRLRGLPFGCSKEEIAHFFTGLPILPNGITILTDHLGRTNGQAFVQFSTEDLVDKALLKHKATIGRRYIEVFKSSAKELSLAAPQNAHYQPPPHQNIGGNFRGSMNQFQQSGFTRDDYFGIPRGARGGPSFSGNVRGRGYYDDGLYGFPRNYGGGDINMGYGGNFGGGFGRGMPNMRNTGIFGPGGHGSNIGRGTGRKTRPFVGGYNNSRNSGFVSQTGYSIHMHGLPYSANEEDIAQFFLPLNPVNIIIRYNPDGRPSGDADVDFATDEEARIAMKRNRAVMQKRYVELFYKASESNRSIRGNLAGNNFATGYSGHGLYNNCTSF